MGSLTRSSVLKYTQQLTDLAFRVTSKKEQGSAEAHKQFSVELRSENRKAFLLDNKSHVRV